jgi:hypothetical protein
MKERPNDSYEPPTVEDLGTLEELTGKGTALGTAEVLGLSLKT